MSNYIHKFETDESFVYNDPPQVSYIEDIDTVVYDSITIKVNWDGCSSGTIVEPMKIIPASELIGIEVAGSSCQTLS